ncbi:vegetative cell wall protein gp1-like [Malania oleifera]|uniref:vegetative cell wall protein gp1-like n=1 Tax=Malania oleifera TaxID=397392 RepID=UPI0025AE5A8F|nr:vegetative cell wall protein gp1-like [Malania oleifera]
MDHHTMPGQTCIFNVNVNCATCEKNLRKLLQGFNGVYAAHIDAQAGKVTVSGNVDPNAILQMLAKAGKKAELVWQFPKGPYPSPHPPAPAPARPPAPPHSTMPVPACSHTYPPPPPSPSPYPYPPAHSPASPHASMPMPACSPTHPHQPAPTHAAGPMPAPAPPIHPAQHVHEHAHQHPHPHPHPHLHSHGNVPAVAHPNGACSSHAQPRDYYMHQLHQAAEIDRMKHVEFVESRGLKMTFKAGDGKQVVSSGGVLGLPPGPCCSGHGPSAGPPPGPHTQQYSNTYYHNDCNQM